MIRDASDEVWKLYIWPLLVFSLHSGNGLDKMKAFREVFSKARNIVVLSGAGISAESGVPRYDRIFREINAIVILSYHSTSF